MAILPSVHLGSYQVSLEKPSDPSTPIGVDTTYMTGFRLSANQRLVLTLLLSAMLGFAAVVIPGLVNASLLSASPSAPAPWLPQVREAVEHIPNYTYFLLFLVGAVLGTLEPDHPKLIGFSSISLLPLVTVVEKSMDIATHPYMTWEITYYIILGCSTVIGAYLGKELST